MSDPATPNIADEYNVRIALLNCHPTDRKVLLDAFNRVHETNTRRQRILKLCQEALSQLRLDLKYLIFDLEATRRERDLAYQELEKNGLR